MHAFRGLSEHNGHFAIIVKRVFKTLMEVNYSVRSR
jgi:hypothetical protein